MAAAVRVLTSDSFKSAADRELVALHRQTGDDEAILPELMRRHGRALHRIAVAVVLNDADADDVLQETFVRAWRNLDRFDGRSSLGTWLRRITVNVAIDLVRRRVGRGLSTLDGNSIAGRDVRPDCQAETDELDAAIEVAMKRLDAKYRAAVALVSIDGLSLRQAAAIAGCNPATMGWRLHEARRRLKRALKDWL